MMLPGITSLSLPSIRLLRGSKTPAGGLRIGQMIQLKSTVVLTSTQKTNLGVARTTLIPPGLCVVKKTADGLFYAANDSSNGDRNTAPSVTGTAHADGNGVIKVVGNHGTISVTTTTGAGTAANHVTDLNANAAFAAFYVASVSGGQLKIAARGVGSQEFFYVHSDTMSGAGFATAVGEDYGVSGDDADYRVLGQGSGSYDDWIDMLGGDGAVADQGAPNLLAGDFVTANLLNLTAEAKACLARRGSTFG